MVMKMFCDECKKEVETNRQISRVRLLARQGEYRFEIMCSKTIGTRNEAHLCIGCLKKLILEGKEW